MPDQRRAIVNASPVIVLHRVGRLDVLAKLYDELVVPHGVLAEIEVGPGGKELRSALERCGVRVVQVSPDARIIEWDLGLGESQVMAAATQYPESVLLLDDRAARRCALALGYPVKGTVGILAEAKRRGLVGSLGEVLDELGRHGFWISEELRRQALQQVGDRPRGVPQSTQG